MDTDLTAVKAALTGISDTELAALIASPDDKPRRSGDCAGAGSVTAADATTVATALFRFPLSRKLLCLGDLRRSHLTCDSVAALDCLFPILCLGGRKT